MGYLLAHDIGTSGVKSTLFGTDGVLLKTALNAYPVHVAQGAVEQDPADWWNAVVVGTRTVVQDIDVREIACVSFSGQAQGCVCVDREGTVLRRALIHADQRAERQTEQIAGLVGKKRIYQITGTMLSPYYSLPKLMWVKEEEPELYAKTYKMLAAKDLIILRLTGEFLSDYTDASMTGAFDLAKMGWATDVIREVGLDTEKFPELRESTFVAGTVTAPAAKETGLLEGTPVVMGGSDGQCGFFGVAGNDTVNGYLYMGSTSTVSAASKELKLDENCEAAVNCHVVPGYYRYYATMQASGISYDWMKEQIVYLPADAVGKQTIYEEIEAYMGRSPVGANGLVYLPYLLGERSPRWNPDAKGAFLGLKAGHKREDLVRAVIEGVTYNMKLNFDIVNSAAARDTLVLYGGNAQSGSWRQCYADVLQREIYMASFAEVGASFGAAVLGGIAVGIYKDYDVIRDFVKIEKVNEPNRENREIYQRRVAAFDQCYQALKDVFPVL